MRAYKITYKCTGSQRLDWVSISTVDCLNNGNRVANIVDAIQSFEELAEKWGTYENKNSITKIKFFEIK